MHAHHHHATGTGKVLQWTLVATVLFVVLEIFAGLRSHSLALLSDAGHNATDALALLLSSFAFLLQSRGADERKTFGYHRAGVLAAFLNALVLILLSLWIFWESYQRLIHPEPVAENWMMAIAAAGLVLNGGIMWGLRGAHAHDINVRSAFIHMLGDLLGAAAILVGGAIIRWTGWLQVDPILSIVIAALIVWTAWDIINESLNILLEGLPRGLELNQVQSAMCCVKGVLDVHDLHIWSIGSSSHALSCHVLIEDVPPSASNCILHDINHVLQDKFKICHSTVQFEHVNCAVSEAGCVIPVDAEMGHHHDHQH
ncbi:MAG TPA: cation diffusion facilitator family transporter [Bryobacteraceae bacterium]